MRHAALTAAIIYITLPVIMADTIRKTILTYIALDRAEYAELKVLAMRAQVSLAEYLARLARADITAHAVSTGKANAVQQK